ncbi:MAG TPA: hypothetical protein VFR59_14625 [Steroidobacteraceae bacterium]|nr:hypothetical protein [Steroidobacteraceae bacterium]HEU4532426.1 hypothetical protein [Steroidobacteraceae bacterium]
MNMSDATLETPWMRLARSLKGLLSGSAGEDLAATAAESLQRENDALASHAVARSRR